MFFTGRGYTILFINEKLSKNCAILERECHILFVCLTDLAFKTHAQTKVLLTQDNKLYLYSTQSVLV